MLQMIIAVRFYFYYLTTAPNALRYNLSATLLTFTLVTELLLAVVNATGDLNSFANGTVFHKF